MLRRKQELDEKELLVKREYDDVQLRAEQFCFEKRQVEEQKEKMEKLAMQIEEESRAIYKYKATVESTRQTLESMRAEVDAKGSLVNAEKAKLEEARKELLLRQQQIEGLRYQYLRDQNVEEASRKLLMSFTQGQARMTQPAPRQVFVEDPAYLNRAPAPAVGRTLGPKSTPFSAARFINEIQSQVSAARNSCMRGSMGGTTSLRTTWPRSVAVC